MGKETENLENFKKAITSTIKSIIGDQNIDVTFGNEVTKKNIKSINLPDIQTVNSKINYLKTRALADSEALKLRCSDINIYNSFEPQGNISKLLYAAAEKLDMKILDLLILKELRNLNHIINQNIYTKYDYDL